MGLSQDLEKIWETIDAEKLEELLLESLDIYSPSGKEEDVQEFYAERLHESGIEVVRQTVEEERVNLLATFGPEPPRLLLVGHVDTVPAWDLDDFSPTAEWGLVRGLGAADMKGGCAAMVEAFRAMAKVLPPERRPPVGLLLVVGEEENGDGSEAFLKDFPLPEWAVIGEPTGLAACFGHFGYLEIGLVTRGRRTHSSLPELGHNAVESMLRLLLQFGRSPLFEKREGGLVYSIRELISSRAGFVVPDKCEAWIDIHVPPELDVDSVSGGVEALCEAARGHIEGIDLDLMFPFAAGGYQLTLDNPLARCLEEACPELGIPLQFEAFRSHSDGNLFHRAGVKPLILGPGALETAHTPDEQVPMAQVEAAARIYAALCLGALT